VYPRVNSPGDRRAETAVSVTLSSYLTAGCLQSIIKIGIKVGDEVTHTSKISSTCRYREYLRDLSQLADFLSARVQIPQITMLNRVKNDTDGKHCALPGQGRGMLAQGLHLRRHPSEPIENFFHGKTISTRHVCYITLLTPYKAGLLNPVPNRGCLRLHRSVMTAINL